MALIKCPDCGVEVSDAAPSCIKCGRPLSRTAPRPKRRVPWIALVGLAIAVVLFLGNVRIVTGAEQLLVPRRSFGFDEPFTSIDACTSGPYFVVMMQHGRLCGDLQAAGLLESEQERGERIEQEFNEKMQRIRQSLP